jgi:pimeloyl-ACP methyl ester carboxylesterase
VSQSHPFIIKLYRSYIHEFPLHREPILINVDIPLGALIDVDLSDSIEVDDGFSDEQAKTAEAVATAVQAGIDDYATANVTVVGHSLGAALALLDAVYLPLHLPADSTNYRTITYGMPRVSTNLLNFDGLPLNNK